MQPRPGLEPLPLSTTSDESAAWYWEGVAALVSGLDHSEDLLHRALHADPTFFLARVALATAAALAGDPYVAPSATAAALRGERQHAEIVAAHFAGHRRRAADLRREHLVEFPADLLVVWLPCQRP